MLEGRKKCKNCGFVNRWYFVRGFVTMPRKYLIGKKKVDANGNIKCHCGTTITIIMNYSS